MLTDQRQAFVREYPKDMNAAAAAERAGYSKRSAKQRGHELLQIPEIQAAIHLEIDARARRTRIEQDRVLEELAAVALSNIEHYTIDDHGHVELTLDAPEHAMRAVSSIKRRRRVIPQGKDAPPIIEFETEIKLWDKNPAIQNAMRHLGMLQLSVNHRFPDGIPAPTPQVPLTADERRQRILTILADRRN